MEGNRHAHGEPVTDCPACAELSIQRGVAVQLGSLALWEWRGHYWRYDDASGGLVKVTDARAVAECDRFAGALA